MNKFSDFGIQSLEDKNIFQVPQISISDIVNCEVIIKDFASDVKTRHGEGRYIIKVEYKGEDKKFFTSAEPIKKVLIQIPKEKFPFMAIIRCQKFGATGKGTFYLE